MFRSPATEAQVTASLAPGASVTTLTGSVVVTDPTSATNVLVAEAAGPYLANTSRYFPSHVTTFYCGDFDVLQLAFVPTVAANGFQVLLEWFSDAAGSSAALIGKTTIETPDVTPCMQAFPVMGPYLRITVTPGASASNARLYAHLRKGGPRSFTAGAGAGGNLFGNTFAVPVLSGGSNTWNAETIVGGPAVLGVYSDAQSWIGIVSYLSSNGGLSIIGGFDTSIAGENRRGDFWQIALPYRKMRVQVFNTSGGTADISVSLTPT